MNHDDSISHPGAQERSPSSSGDSPAADDPITAEGGGGEDGDSEESILRAVEEAFAVAETQWGSAEARGSRSTGSPGAPPRIGLPAALVRTPKPVETPE